jgi:Fe-S-cluster-containing hydrogenase component 2
MTHVVAEPCFACKYTDCVVVCPVECIELDPAHPETPEGLLAKYHQLTRGDAAA